MKKFITACIIAALTWTNVSAETIYDSKTTTTVASGITRTEIRRFASEGFQYINVVEADLSNQYVTANVVLPEKGLSALESVPSMAKKNNTSAIVNGDFFAWKGNNSTLGSAVGPVVKDGEVYSTSATQSGMASFGIFDNGAVADYFKITATITAENGKSTNVRHINKYDPLDAVCIYTRDFYKTTPGAVNNIWEVLVTDGVIQQINNQGQTIDIPENGYVIRCLPEYNSFVPDNLRVGQKLRLDISTSFDSDKIRTLMGGGTLLVKDGKKAKVTHSVNGNNPRTALGTDKTGKKIYLITVDGRNDYSVGMTLTQLADFMLEYGIYNGINLDGGGSTTMVVKDYESGNQEAVNSMVDTTYFRPVANGLGVYSSAPAGSAATFEIKTEKVFSGVSATFEVHNVKDTYGNPNSEKIAPSFFVDPAYGYFEGNVFHAKKSGNNIEVKATYKGFTAKKYINICPLDKIEAYPSHFKNGTTPVFDLYGYSPNGEKIIIEKSNISLKGSKVYAGGKETSIVISNMDETFNSSKFNVTVYPSGKVTASGTYDKTKTLDGNGSLKLTFDFTDSSTDTKAAYVTLNKTVSKKYGLISVYAGGNRQWLRAEFADKDGNVLRSDICTDMNFTGWKHIPFEVPENAVVLKRIYVVQNTLQNRNKASVYFDTLSFSDTLPAGVEHYDTKAEYSSQKGDSDFTVFAGVSPVKNLLTASLKKSLENALVKEKATYNFSLEGVTFDKVNEKTIKSHSSFSDGKGIYINLDNSDGYLSNAQFVKFKNDLLKTNKNVFIFMNEEIDLMKSKEELQILKNMMYNAALDKNVFVFYPSEANSILKENGVSFVKVAGVKNSSAKGVAYYPQDFGYYTVTAGTTPKVVFKSVLGE